MSWATGQMFKVPGSSKVCEGGTRKLGPIITDDLVRNPKSGEMGLQLLDHCSGACVVQLVHFSEVTIVADSDEIVRLINAEKISADLGPRLVWHIMRHDGRSQTPCRFNTW